MRHKQAAVFAMPGLGNGLMMMVASHRLFMQGYAVVTFHDSLIEMRHWFPKHQFARLPSPHDLEWIVEKFDIVIAQGGDDHLTKHLSDLYHKDALKTLSIFYSTYDKTLDPPLSPWDRVFSSKKPMVDNIAKAVASLFHLNQTSKNNGLIPLSGLTHRHHKQRVVITPLTDWTPPRILKTMRALEELDYHPLFLTPPHDRTAWEARGCPTPAFATLSEVAEAIYESGYVISADPSIIHLASNLQVPSLILEKNARPGWLSGKVVAPPSFWRPVPHVISHFKKLIKEV